MAVPSPFQGVPLTLSLSADPCIFAWVVKTWLFRHLSRVPPLTLSQSADPLSPLGRLMLFSPSHTCGPPSGSLARSTGGPRSHPQRFRSHCRLHPGRAASLLVLPYKCCSTLPRPGDTKGGCPVSSPPGSTVPALTAPLVPTRQGSVTTTPFRQVPDPGPPGGQNAAQRHASTRARGCSTGWSVGPRRLPPAAEAWFEAPSFPTSAAAPCHGRGTVGSGCPMSHRQAHVRPSRAP